MTRLAKNPVRLAGKLTDHAKLKLALMSAIDTHIRRRFQTLEAAARTARFHRVRLSRIRNGDHSQCSIAFLLRVARRLETPLRIDVQLI
jgi:predicted XRE-type DNA-binding protein